MERKEATASQRENLKCFFYKPPSVAANKRDLLERGLLWMLDVIDTYLEGGVGGYVMPGGDQAGAGRDKSLPYLRYRSCSGTGRSDRTVREQRGGREPLRAKERWVST